MNEPDRPYLAIARGVPGALKVLTEHLDLTELCRNHQIAGSLIWVVYKDVCKMDPQVMKKLLLEPSNKVAAAVREVPSANQEFFGFGHPYGVDPANKAKPKQPR